MCAFAGTAIAQSVLNFTPKGLAGIAITNTTGYAADVKFTLYNLDGTVATTGLTNNPSYRIPANGQLAMMTSAIFRAKDGFRPTGWIQATSAATGLQGFYFSGDFGNTFDGAEASSPFQLQTIPFIASGGDAHTTVLVTNPGTQSVDVTVTFLDASGRIVPNGSLAVPGLAPHAQVSVDGMGVTARVAANSSPGVLATSVEESATALALIPGQSPDAQNGQWVVPYFKNGGSFVSTLALANPSPSPAVATVSFFNNAGERVYVTKEPVTVPASGSRVVTWRDITGYLILPPAEGWLLVQSNLPLAGVALVGSGVSATSIPMQASGSPRILLSRAVTQGLSTQLILVGDSERDATVKITLSRADGSTAAQDSLAVGRGVRISGLLSDLVSTAGFESGFLTIQSTVPIYSLELMDLPGGFGQAVVVPQRRSAAFAPTQAAAAPWIKVTVEGDLLPKARLKIDALNVQADAMLWVGNLAVPITPTLFGPPFSANLPEKLDPGPITVKVRSAGLDSNIESLGYYSVNGASIEPDSPVIKGYALFQKVEVTDNGLDTNLTSMVPIRNALVEVIDRVIGATVSVSETDENGRFETRVSDPRGLTIRVASRLRFQDLKVLNNSANNTPYFISQDLDALETGKDIELVDTSRNAGAFNILDALQRGNTLIMNAAPGLTPPALTVYWSVNNDAAALAKLTNGAIRTTFFNAGTNAAYILGDRNTDSDEYDDSVILHEYAHLLAAKFSRDDSNGGTHLLGDLLDPRIAWSEGWANFFSSAARGSSIYRDSNAQGTVLRLDLEENVPAGDHPGYYSEATVDGLLWDLIDENADKDDTAQFSFASIWSAFTDLTRYRNVYLPYFLENFLQRNPGFADGLRTMVIARSIDFQPDVRPSVTNPFPATIAIGQFRTGQVDSFITKRTNLSGSSHFFSLSTATGGQVSIKLAIETLGAANNPSANDLDLFLYDTTGKRIINQSDSPYNGGGEVISTTLAPGTYFIEIRSFYVREQTNSTVFNSGGYRLSVDRF